MIWGTGVAVGIAIGVAIGAVMDNVGIGIGIGIAIGMALSGAAYAFQSEKPKPRTPTNERNTGGDRS